MKIRLPVTLVWLAFGFTLPAFAQQKDTVDPKIVQQMRVFTVKYEQAYNSHDPAAIAALTRTNLKWPREPSARPLLSFPQP
jgi:hypothetical protein